MLDGVGDAADAAGDHGSGVGHRLDRDEAERLGVASRVHYGRQAEDRAAFVEGGELGGSNLG